MTTWTVDGFYGSQILLEVADGTLNVGDNFMLDPAWDYTTSHRTFVFSDDDPTLSDDSANHDVGDDSNQTVTVYDASGTQIYSGRVYSDWSATFTDPSGATITMYGIRIGTTMVGEITTAPLTPGVTYQITSVSNPSSQPLYDALASMTFDPDLANSIQGGDYDDSIAAGALNDTINTGAGADTIDGGTGDDLIEFGIGGDLVYGGDGNDTIDDYAGSTGYVWNDTIYGDAGNDLIYAGGGDDYIDGGTENDSIYAEDGNDTIFGGDGNDLVYASTGNDSIDGGTGNDSLFGDDGNDTIDGGDGNDSIRGGNGDDSILGGAGVDIILGDAGNDTIRGGDGADHLAGNAGNDVLYGEADADTFYFEAGWGADTVWGGSTTTSGGVDEDILNFSYLSGTGVTVTFTDLEDGSATDGTNTVAFDNIEGITGSSQADTINASVDSSGLTLDGGAGNDSITAGAGADSILGGTGNDTIYSGLGSDTIYGGDGNDYIDDLAGVRAEVYESFVDAGIGDDTVYTGGGSDTIHGGEGLDKLYGEAGDDLIYGDAGADTIDGGAGNDTIWGGADGDSVWGGTGNDVIYGEGGDDTILGAAGNDTISGGSGSDHLYGDDDSDTFLYYYGAGAGSIYGGEGGVDFDTVQLYGASANVVWSGWEYGTITYSGDASTHYFWEIESVTGTDFADTFDASASGDGVSLDAGGGDDLILGSDFADSLSAGTGDDCITGGAGDDTITTGTGLDTIVLADGDGNDLVTDFDMTANGALTTDQLDVSDLNDTLGNPINVWDVTVGDDGSGNAVLGFPDGTTLTLVGISRATVEAPGVLHAMGIPCIVAGMRVATPRGPVPVELLKPGDLVTTRAGPQPVLWAGARRVSGAEMRADPGLIPIEIKAGRFGAQAPVRLSALHGVFVPAGAGALARAGHIAATGWGGARVLSGLARQDEGVSYHHLLLPHHGLICVEGVWVESFWPGRQGIAALDLRARAALIRALPRLAATVWGPKRAAQCYGPPAARFLKRCQIDRAACAKWSHKACDVTHIDGFVTEPVALKNAFPPVGNDG